jgi:hypothetical protein
MDVSRPSTGKSPGRLRAELQQKVSGRGLPNVGMAMLGAHSVCICQQRLGVLKVCQRDAKQVSFE